MRYLGQSYTQTVLHCFWEIEAGLLRLACAPGTGQVEKSLLERCSEAPPAGLGFDKSPRFELGSQGAGVRRREEAWWGWGWVFYSEPNPLPSHFLLPLSLGSAGSQSPPPAPRLGPHQTGLFSGINETTQGEPQVCAMCSENARQVPSAGRPGAPGPAGRARGWLPRVHSVPGQQPCGRARTAAGLGGARLSQERGLGPVGKTQISLFLQTFKCPSSQTLLNA